LVCFGYLDIIPEHIVETDFQRRYSGPLPFTGLQVRNPLFSACRQLPQLIQLSGGNLTEEQRTQFQEQLLDGQIRNLAMEQQARKLGYSVTNAQLARAFQSEPAFLVDGQFNAAVAREALTRAGISEEAYLADLRRSQLSGQLLSVIGASEFLRLWRSAVGLQDEQRKCASWSAGAVRGGAGDRAGSGRAWHANPAQFTPGGRAFAYAELAGDAPRRFVLRTRLRERYESAKDRFMEPERAAPAIHCRRWHR
jgi:hypothetical protein